MTTVRAEDLGDVRHVTHGIALASTKDLGKATILMRCYRSDVVLTLSPIAGDCHHGGITLQGTPD